MGPSALNSMEEPWTKAPAAMMTGASYPGMSQGSGVTKLSTGAAAWMPWQKATTPSGVPKVMDWMMSWRSSLLSGTTANPSFSFEGPCHHGGRQKQPLIQGLIQP